MTIKLQTFTVLALSAGVLPFIAIPLPAAAVTVRPAAPPPAESAERPASEETEKVEKAEEVRSKPVLLRPGHRGEAVRTLQRKLHRGRYYFGRINGVYDEQTKFAVWAFQKHKRMMPRKEVGPKLLAALDKPVRHKVLVPGGAPDRVEIDLRNQLLTVYRDRRPALISHVSTGAEVRYCENGRCGNAITPTGDFRVLRRAPGWTTGPLGSMYNSLYFTGAIAMHGSSKVPLQPASHGCVRVPLETSKRLYQMVKIGEPVHVRGKIM
ncbi:L,D-transpeptidase family protein [Nonomuraea sp. NPDC004580]|uniref:L,D-transpeptidase family protein n=1 Tax=Nonomuraea sp. NPDC004580 TaxID=3154552 RepID=UPI00339F4329